MMENNIKMELYGREEWFRRERKVADGKGQKRKNLILSTQDLLDLIKTHFKTVLPVVLYYC